MNHYRIFNLLAIGAFLIASSSCKEIEGCKDPAALNYEPKADVDNNYCIYPNESPTIEFVVPSSNTLELSDLFPVEVSLTDDEAPAAVEITLSNDEYGTYYTTKRSVEEDASEFATDISLPEIDLLGSSTILTVGCYDNDGGAEFDEMEIAFSDNTSPSAVDVEMPDQIKAFESEYFSMKAYDRGGIAEFTVTILYKESWNSTFNEWNTQTYEYDDFLIEVPWNQYLYFYEPGDVKVQYTITDNMGNVTTAELTAIVVW